ncbi:response regulator transcription factor [Paenibacillus sp. GCM10027626]|uniref:response regulator transcription factor n=1 Tax=Paenibacillus sp. GCM10027626 TaxID=3273411 RepID=UPI003640E2FA
MASILIVEDDKLLNEGLAFALSREQYRTKSAFSYAGGWAALEAGNFDLVILDIQLPDRSGIELCEALRAKSAVPVIFLTANDTEQDIVAGFERGADDYITKPFSMPVLVQHVRAVLRRSGNDEPGDKWEYKELAIHHAKRKVYKRGQEVHLTANEYKLLTLLIEHRKQVLTRQLILEKLWDADGNYVDENTLSVTIKRLRSKIETDPRNCEYITTVFGIGYTWGADE